MLASKRVHSHRHSIFASLPGYASMSPSLPDSPAWTCGLLFTAESSLEFVNKYTCTPARRDWRRCSHSSPHQQPAPGMWAVTHSPALAASTESLTHAGPPQALFLGGHTVPASVGGSWDPHLHLQLTPHTQFWLQELAPNPLKHTELSPVAGT